MIPHFNEIVVKTREVCYDLHLQRSEGIQSLQSRYVILRQRNKN